MELAHQEGVEQAGDEVWVEAEEEAVAGWEVTGLEPDQAGSVFALIAGHGYPIK